MRVLILGAQGMVGQAVFGLLKTEDGWIVDGSQRRDLQAPFWLDVEGESSAYSKLMSEGRYDYIVNCMGVLQSGIDEKDSESVLRAINVNSVFPHRLASIAAEMGARVLHVSTDGVFSDNAHRCLETDAISCSDVYGRTKALGECPASNVLNVRCSFAGRDRIGRKGLFEWILSSTDGAELPGYTNHLWNGVTTLQFAELCRRILRSGSFDGIRTVSGVHHFCPNPPLTKYELLCLVKEAARLEVVIKPTEALRERRRTLGSVYTEFEKLYPSTNNWPTVISEALFRDDVG